MAVATESRIDVLARPKPVHPAFLENLRSVYWENKYCKDWSSQDHNTKFCVSQRVEELLKPKGFHKDYLGDRPTPIWTVSKIAMKANPTPRLESLATAKSYHPEFQHRKSAYTTVSSAAKNASASERIEKLAEAKVPHDLPIKPNSSWDFSEWPSEISPAAMKHEPSVRTQSLAVARELPSAYKEVRPVVWTVSAGAKKALPSMRVQQLARPKSRREYKEDYDSAWCKVSPGAKNARPTPRLEELAAPIPRKVRQKKQGAVKV